MIAQTVEMKPELVFVPVTDVDRAAAFYVDRVDFVADHDHQVDRRVRWSRQGVGKRRW